ncbi:helix-turn-helix transcriptional regulator [Clostridium sp. D53t1_180928_C8]|uniref:helix-turn-helix domain-containing protein n=1 Tax=Clostridium sp. D53t1_180928_C8 TaxID=2787101 RepID=UPI0018AAB39C|nr:helix-turn-helix transcriptional regulator [Clostridium sp. D53t1_180928_C8]
MRINEIIRKNRVLQDLTQEQIADYLGVSTPAVNKWERGVSYPDITLLPSLARVLKIDLNTLLSFKEDLSDKEIANFINELSTVINDDGFEKGFEIAIDKVHKYPTCDKLILNIGLTLQGSMFMYNVENKEKYEEKIDKLFEKAFNSEDIEVKNQAIPMIMNKYFEKKEYEKAQECIDKIPNITYDKKIMQARLYREQGSFKKGSEIYEGKLLSVTSEIFISLTSMMEIALEESRDSDAEYYADILEKTANLYDLWEYNSYVSYFQLYIKQKDEEKCVEVIKKILRALKNKWDISSSMLYKNINKKEGQEGINKIFLLNFINMLESSCDKELSFLKNNEEFIKILKEYK